MTQTPLSEPPVPKLAPRAAESHKGTYGRVLAVAGSRGMSGAAILCGSAALRSGAGLVQVACPTEIQLIVACGNPCYTTFGIHHGADGLYSARSLAEVLELTANANTLAIGPGLCNRPDVASFVQGLLAEADEIPTVLDADGLNVLSQRGASFQLAGKLEACPTLQDRAAPLVMTPHPGEFAKLLGIPRDEVQLSREALAVEFASKWKIILVLKGHRTIVTDGAQLYTNTTGNPGMATGGTGDVLTGLIAALLAQGMAALDAAILGVWAHGRAGDLAAAELGQTSLIASDLLGYLPRALRERESAT